MGKLNKKILLIDLDGVLNEYKGKFETVIPPVKKGAREFLEKLSKDFKLQIFTTRNRLSTSRWLIENKLDDFVSDVTNVKNPAYLCIDDRCVCFEGDYNKTIDRIKNFKTYWKKD